jgi:1-deoxy-D-xylulose-5-phosphate reductoisomerase
MFAVARLDFEAPDLARFPCLRLAVEAMERGGTAPTILNAANEIAVEAFLDGRIGFTAIAEVIEQTLSSMPIREASALSVIFEDDTAAREVAARHVAAAGVGAAS